MVRGFGGRVLSTVAEGMEATVRLAGDDELDGVTGRYFEGRAGGGPRPQAYDADARRKLWELSEELTGGRRSTADLTFRARASVLSLSDSLEVEMSETMLHTTIESPVGDLLLIGDEQRLHGLYMQEGRRPARCGRTGVRRASRSPLPVSSWASTSRASARTSTSGWLRSARGSRSRSGMRCGGSRTGSTASYGEIARADRASDRLACGGHGERAATRSRSSSRATG